MEKDFKELINKFNLTSNSLENLSDVTVSFSNRIKELNSLFEILTKQLSELKNIDFDMIKNDYLKILKDIQKFKSNMNNNSTIITNILNENINIYANIENKINAIMEIVKENSAINQKNNWEIKLLNEKIDLLSFNGLKNTDEDSIGILKSSIEILKISKRIKEILIKSNLLIIDDIMNKSDDDLITIAKISNQDVKKIRNAVDFFMEISF